jgi:nucleotide-binding universal stress UspA family protein
MKNVLIAVDDSRNTLAVIDKFHDLFSRNRPGKVVLLYVEKIEGRSLMDEMLGSAEIETLKEELKGTSYQKHLDEKAQKVIAFFRKALEKNGSQEVETVIREGHPSEEILKVAEEKKADLIIIGSKGRRRHSLLMGSVSREVANRAGTSVLLAR